MNWALVLDWTSKCGCTPLFTCWSTLHSSKSISLPPFERPLVWDLFFWRLVYSRHVWLIRIDSRTRWFVDGSLSFWTYPISCECSILRPCSDAWRVSQSFEYSFCRSTRSILACLVVEVSGVWVVECCQPHTWSFCWRVWSWCWVHSSFSFSFP